MSGNGRPMTLREIADAEYRESPRAFPRSRACAHLPTMNRTQSRRLSMLKHRKQVERIGEKAASVALPFFVETSGAEFFRDILTLKTVTA